MAVAGVSDESAIPDSEALSQEGEFRLDLPAMLSNWNRIS